VIALDRIQCHYEVPVGSGRPSSAELAGTRRVYLDSRPVAAGAVAPRHAINRLIRLQQEFCIRGVTDLILEGGSLSLLHELETRSDWRSDASLRVTVCVERSAAAYEAAVAARVEKMLGYGASQPARTLQAELAGLWDDPVARKAASQIIGYSEAIALCEQHSIRAHDLAGPAGRVWRYDLAHRITAGHLAYAAQQRAALSKALPALESVAEEVTLCEI
jgi:tRNA A37 N6-isopentenylltransferase MiaA